MLEPPVFPTETDKQLRAALEDWFYRFQHLQVFVPPGATFTFAGATLPEGYVWADGTEYALTKYPELYKTLGNTYGGTPGTSYKVPNLGATWIIKV